MVYNIKQTYEDEEDAEEEAENYRKFYNRVERLREASSSSGEDETTEQRLLKRK